MRIMLVMLGEIRLSSESIVQSFPLNGEPELNRLSPGRRVGRGLTSRQAPAALPEAKVALRIRPGRGLASQASTTHWERSMPIILWLLGVPLAVVILLMLLHVI
jgi:hypothetical protein